MACSCNKNKTVYTVTYENGGTQEFTSRQDALVQARVKGGTVTTKVVPK
jgi:hypothetical protein